MVEYKILQNAKVGESSFCVIKLHILTNHNYGLTGYKDVSYSNLRNKRDEQ